MVFLDRDFRLPVNPKDLLDGIRRETAQIKRWSLGLGMVSVVNWSGRVRGGIARLVPPDRCLSSAVFSNMGTFLADCSLPRQDPCVVAGDVRLESIESIPATRPNTNVILTVATYAGRLNVCMGYDHRIFSPTQSQGLFQSFIHQVRTSAERSSPA